MSIELRHLRYFVAVAEEEHFGRAALRLRLSQPSLSRQMQALERALGVTLFDRLPRGVRLSGAGRVLLGDARRLLAEVDAAVARVRGAAAAPVAVGAVEAALRSRLVPSAVADHRARFPEGWVSVARMPSRAQWTALREGSIDVGVVYSVPPEGEGLAAERLGDDPLDSVLLSASHPLAGRASVGLGELAGETLLLFPRPINPAFHDRLFAAFAAAGFAPRAVQEADEGAPLYSLAAEGLGWSLQPRSYRSSPPEGTAAVPLADFALPLELWLLWRRDEREPQVLAFLAALRNRADA